MKKFLFPALALGLVLTSCQSDEPFAPGMGEEVQATFTISVPDAMGTRAGEVNSALGGFSNGAGNLNYTVALLRAEDDVVMWSSKTPASVNGKSATFNPTVVQGYTYKIVAYATFDSAIEAPTVGSKIPADSGLGAIATLEGINNESEDAYFCNTKILGASSMEATLKRPFGKLRLVAEDYDKFHALGLEVAKVKVTYGGAVVMNTQFDASTKAFEGTATSKVFEFEGETSYSAEADKNNNGVYTVFTDYLPASETGETMYPFTIEVTYKNGKGTYTRTFSQDIPVKRNYLTTLRGNFFTTEAALTLKVEEMFANSTELDAKYTYFTVDTNDELKAALTSNHEHIYVELDANVTYDVAAWENSAMGGDKTKSITINGKQVVTRGGSYDKTLTFNQTNSDWNNIATKNGAKLILKNLNVTNSGRNDGPWNRHDLNFACDVEMDSVYSDKAIALKAGGVLKNVTINDKNTSDTYALWIQPKGQVVTLENCVIDMLDCTDGRGIKIDEQYVNEVKAPTLNVSGTIFKTKEKAAVIVKSKDGAIINWGERNDISKVAADTECAVWVDEASADYASKVVVNGAIKRVEGIDVAKTSSQDDLNNAVNNANTTVLLSKGEYTFPADIKKGVTIVCEEGVVFKGNSKLNINGATVVGATFSNPSGTAVDQTINGSFKNCTFTGSNALRWCYAGETVEFDNCVFDGNLYGIQFDGGANDAIFRNCTISGFNAFGSVMKMVTFENCTFKGNGKSGYNGANLWGSAKMINCEFTFDGTTSTEWIDCIGKDKTYEFTNCTVNGVAYTPNNYADISKIFSRNKVSVTINGVKCAMQ